MRMFNLSVNRITESLCSSSSLLCHTPGISSSIGRYLCVHMPPLLRPLINYQQPQITLFISDPAQKIFMNAIANPQRPSRCHDRYLWYLHIIVKASSHQHPVPSSTSLIATLTSELHPRPPIYILPIRPLPKDPQRKLRRLKRRTRRIHWQKIPPRQSTRSVTTSSRRRPHLVLAPPLTILLPCPPRLRVLPHQHLKSQQP